MLLIKIHLQLNVLIDNGGNAVLCDFGFSRVKADIMSHSKTTNRGEIAGSRNWMVPELLSGSLPKKPSDIYAVGMTIYEVGVIQDVSGPSELMM